MFHFCKGDIKRNRNYSYQSHGIDTNVVLGKFSYKEEDEKHFLADLKAEGEVFKAEGFLFKVDKEANLINFKSKQNYITTKI